MMNEFCRICGVGHGCKLSFALSNVDEFSKFTVSETKAATALYSDKATESLGSFTFFQRVRNFEAHKYLCIDDTKHLVSSVF